MIAGAKGGAAGDLDLAPPPPTLLDSPLDYITAEHARQRRACESLKRLAADGHASRREIETLLAYIACDLQLHHDDEERDLFPAIRKRALPIDELEPVLARLSDDHRNSEALIDAIVAGLTAARSQGGCKFSPALCARMQAYAESEQQHLAIENAVVLTIAQVRLTRQDLARMSVAMKARRGLITAGVDDAG